MLHTSPVPAEAGAEHSGICNGVTDTQGEGEGEDEGRMRKAQRWGETYDNGVHQNHLWVRVRVRAAAWLHHIFSDMCLHYTCMLG